jgi:hypothetical protein
LVAESEDFIGNLDQVLNRQNAVVRLDDRVGHIGRRKDRIGTQNTVRVLLTEFVQYKDAQSRTGATAQRTDQLEALQSVAAFAVLPDGVKDRLDNSLISVVVTFHQVVAGTRIASVWYLRFIHTLDSRE